MRTKIQTFNFTNTDFIKYWTESHNILFREVTLTDVSVIRETLAFRYRYLNGWGWGSISEPWREIRWKRVSEGKKSISFIGDIRLDNEKKHLFEVKMKCRKNEYTIGEWTFSGIGIEFEALTEIPFAMEIEIGLPLNDVFKKAYIQDLYTPEKCSSMTDGWKLRPGIWQCQRSPFDFLTFERGTFLTRINSLTQLFSSTGEYDGKGPLLKYKYTMESCCKWKTAELSFLFNQGKNDPIREQDLWCEIFLSESARFRAESGVKNEEVIPMANIPIDGGTPGCNPENDRKIQGKFNDFAAETIALCKEMNFKRVLVGSPWVSYRSRGMFVKTQPDLIYDSRCGIIDFEIADEYGGRKALRDFCDKAHKKGIEVFLWYPGFHLANHSRHLTEHPEWIIRKHDGSAYTYVYFHLTAISPRLEVQKYFIENLKNLKDDCGFDGLWLDSYGFSFHTLDFSKKQGVSNAAEGIAAVRRLQEIGFKIINEDFAPFGARGSGEAMLFKGQEEAAVETSIFTYYKNIPAVLEDNSYFRFLANKAPLTIAARHIPENKKETISRWNSAFNEAVKFMMHRTLLPRKQGVLWRNNDNNVEILFTYKNITFRQAGNAVITDLISRKSGQDVLLHKNRIYKIEYK